MNINIKKPLLLISLIFLIIASALGSGKINYTGMLNQDGVAVTGAKNITFKIYNTLTGGTLLWNSGVKNINVVNGKFNYILGQDSELNSNIFLNNARVYLEITVESEILSPREEILKPPYAELAGAVNWDDIIGIPTNISNQEISDNSITTAKIADGAVTNAKIASLAWSKITDVPSGLGGTSTEPLFSASVSSGIVAGDITKWNSAVQPEDMATATTTLKNSLATVATSGSYSDLSEKPTNVSAFTNDAGYLTAATGNSEPLFIASISSGIVSGDIIKWNTAVQPATLSTATATLKSTIDTSIAISTTSLKSTIDTNVATSTTNLKASLATVATSGSYSDLSGKPTNVSAFTNDAGYLTTLGDGVAMKTDVATATTTLKATIETSIAISTGTINSNLNSEITNRANADSAIQTQVSNIATSTGTINTSLAAVIVSTGALQSSLNAVILSTGNIQTQLNNITISTQSFQSQINAITVSTTTMQNQMNQIAASTGTVQAQMMSLLTLTGTIQNQMNSISISTAAIQIQFDSIAASTGTINSNLNSEITNRTNADSAIQTQVTNIAASTGTINTSLAAVIVSTGTLQTSLNAVIASTGTFATKASPTLTGNITAGTSSVFYFGDSSTDGTWCVQVESNNLVFKRRESGVYVTKTTVTP